MKAEEYLEILKYDVTQKFITPIKNESNNASLVKILLSLSDLQKINVNNTDNNDEIDFEKYLS